MGLGLGLGLGLERIGGHIEQGQHEVAQLVVQAEGADHLVRGRINYVVRGRIKVRSWGWG